MQKLYNVLVISIHSLVKRETQKARDTKKFFAYFNPLPRKEGDDLQALAKQAAEISIHSLVKRETVYDCEVDDI